MVYDLFDASRTSTPGALGATVSEYQAHPGPALYARSPGSV